MWLWIFECMKVLQDIFKLNQKHITAFRTKELDHESHVAGQPIRSIRWVKQQLLQWSQTLTMYNVFYLHQHDLKEFMHVHLSEF